MNALALIAIAALVLVNGFFVAAEFALVSDLGAALPADPRCDRGVATVAPDERACPDRDRRARSGQRLLRRCRIRARLRSRSGAPGRSSLRQRGRYRSPR